MDTKFGGLSWGTVYKKIENFCNDNDLVQIPRKYADTVGKHVKILIDEVVSDWIDPPGSCADGSDTEIWMMPLTTDVVSERSMEGLEEKKPDNVLSDVTNANSKASYVGKMDMASSCHLHYHENSDSHSQVEGAISTEEGSCINLIDECDYENSSSSSVPLGGLLDAASLPSEPLIAEALTYQGYNDKPIEPGSLLDGSDSHAEIFDLNRTLGFVSVAECCEDVHSKKDTFKKSDHMLDGVGPSVAFHKGDYFNHVISHDLDMELTGQFQEIDLHGSWDDDEDYELAMISLHESRKRPFKKNLTAAFISKLRMLRKKNNGSKFHSDFDVQKLDRRGSCTVDSAKRDMDSDWELL